MEVELGLPDDNPPPYDTFPSNKSHKYYLSSQQSLDSIHDITTPFFQLQLTSEHPDTPFNMWRARSNSGFRSRSVSPITPRQRRSLCISFFKFLLNPLVLSVAFTIFHASLHSALSPTRSPSSSPQALLADFAILANFYLGFILLVFSALSIGLDSWCYDVRFLDEHSRARIVVITAITYSILTPLIIGRWGTMTLSNAINAKSNAAMHNIGSPNLHTAGFHHEHVTDSRQMGVL